MGGDFLPKSYSNAATCACSGGGNPDWNSPAAACVRMKLGEMHRQLSDATKREMKEASRGSFIKFTDLVYEMHDIAYKKCCCMGKIAPKATWLL
eukprot:gene8921-870_t